MKKIISILLVMLLCVSMLSLAACDKKDDAAADAGDTAVDAGTADTGDTGADDTAGDAAADAGAADDAGTAEDTDTGDTAAAADPVKVFVVISSEGQLVLHEDITAEDADGDGVVTLTDALASAHTAKGNADGYLAQDTEYGISISKLWGVENGGSYGFYLNNTFVDTLLAPVAEGDVVSAYSFADLTGWSDVFSYFDKTSTSSTGELTLTLTYIAFDENWAPVPTPAAGINITVDGAATDSVTDENGAVTLTLDDGVHVISATTDTMTLVPPVCVAAVGK